MKIEGDLTYANAHRRWQALVREVTSSTEIDLSGVTKIDSAGLALLTALRGYRDTNRGKSGGKAAFEDAPRRLIHASPEIRRLATAYDIAALLD